MNLAFLLSAFLTDRSITLTCQEFIAARLKDSLPAPEELEEKILFDLGWIKISVANKVGSFSINVSRLFSSGS